MTNLEAICALLARAPFLVDDEKRLQADIAAALAVGGIAHEREVRLAPTDIIDFVAGRVGIEVKIKGSKRAILRQVERYATSDRLDAIVLLTGIAIGMPETITGKPVRIVSLGRSWL